VYQKFTKQISVELGILRRFRIHRVSATTNQDGSPEMLVLTLFELNCHRLSLAVTVTVLTISGRQG